jgi:hypothetical protein
MREANGSEVPQLLHCSTNAGLWIEKAAHMCIFPQLRHNSNYEPMFANLSAEVQFDR